LSHDHVPDNDYDNFGRNKVRLRHESQRQPALRRVLQAIGENSQAEEEKPLSELITKDKNQDIFTAFPLSGRLICDKQILNNLHPDHPIKRNLFLSDFKPNAVFLTLYLSTACQSFADLINRSGSVSSHRAN